MRSARTLLRSYRDWTGNRHGIDYRATIGIVGWACNPYEPLLLEALANHPGCHGLHFIPLDGKCEGNLIRFGREVEDLPASQWHEHLRTPAPSRPIRAYDIQPLLLRHGGPPLSPEAIDARLIAHFKEAEPRVLQTDRIQFYLSGHGHHELDGFIQRRNPAMALSNDAGVAYGLDKKFALPHFCDRMEERTGIYPAPTCGVVTTAEEVREFMDRFRFDQIVLKSPDNSSGHGIYRIFRDGERLMVDHADKDFEPTPEHPRIFPLDDAWLDEAPMLAMRWLDTGKGDIRVVIQNGGVVGAYKRMAQDGSWLCNYYQGARIVPVDWRRDLSAADRRMVREVAQELERLCVSTVSIDLLADEQGKRYLSEINIGNTDDIVELHRYRAPELARHGRMSIADQMAADLMQDYRRVAEHRHGMAVLKPRGMDTAGAVMR